LTLCEKYKRYFD